MMAGGHGRLFRRMLPTAEAPMNWVVFAFPFGAVVLF